MESRNAVDGALNDLLKLADCNGYLIFDDITNAADRWNLSIRDVDYLSSSIATRGILVYDEAPVTSASSADDEYEDYAQSDYDLVFDKVIALAPDLENLITEIRTIVPPQAREMDQLKYQVTEGNLFARERVIQMHLRFAVRIALQRVETFGCDMEETLQDAFVGLILAVDKYNPDSSGPFGSYASLWILQNIGRTQGTQRPLIYYPFHKKEDYFSGYPLLKSKGCTECEGFRECNQAREYLSDKLECSAEAAEEIINQSLPLESFEDTYDMFLKNMDDYEKQGIWNVNGSTYPLEIFAYQENFESVDLAMLSSALNDILDTLTSREKEVILLRFGFHDGREHTLEEVGNEFGVTRERIRQIEAKALRKLRHPSRSRKIKGYID